MFISNGTYSELSVLVHFGVLPSFYNKPIVVKHCVNIACYLDLDKIDTKCAPVYALLV